MDRHTGVVIRNGPILGFIRTPGAKDRIFYLKDAPPAIAKLRSVSYRLLVQPDKPHDRAVDIQLMEVA